MMDDQEAKERARILQKFRDESTKKQGGKATIYMQFGVATLAYSACGIITKTERVPYKLFWGIMGFGLGGVIGQKAFGQPNYQLYYTKKEYEILKQQFGERYLKHCKVIDIETEQQNGNNTQINN